MLYSLRSRVCLLRVRWTEYAQASDIQTQHQVERKEDEMREPIPELETDRLRKLLFAVLDAHYGTDLHHVGDGDGIPEWQADELREFYDEEMVRRRKSK